MDTSLFSLVASFPILFPIAILIFFLLTIFVLYLYFTKRLVRQKEIFAMQLEKEKEIARNKTLLLAEMSDEMVALTENLVHPNEAKDEELKEEIFHSANNLRELLKIQANKIEIYKEKFILSHMLDDISTYLASNFTQRYTEVVFYVHPTVPRYLTGDVIHCSRIINNILEFAIHTTPEGKVTLEISCDKPLQDDIILNITIEDNGKGLGTETFQSLFVLNYDDAKREQWGYGLYIAKKLTLAIGGTIQADSIVDSGNHFSLQIPMHLNEDSRLKEFAVLKETLSPKKVLIYLEKEATGDALEALFHYFYEEVVRTTRMALDKRLVNPLDFDVIVLDDIFFTPNNITYLQSIKA